MNTMCPKCEEEDCYVHAKNLDKPENKYYCVACDDCGFEGPEADNGEDAITSWDRYCYSYWASM